MLNRLAIAFFAKLNGRAFQDTSSLSNRGSQSQMRFGAACKTADIINDDAHLIFAVLIDIVEQLSHRWTFDQAS